jgi:DNA-binding XRE family transcriptional regulator
MVAAEEGRGLLAPEAALRLRHLVKVAETAGNIPERPHLGMLIRQARVAMGRTQTELADSIGIRQSTYARLEQAINPRFATVQRVAAALKIPVQWILRGEVPLADSLLGS